MINQFLKTAEENPLGFTADKQEKKILKIEKSETNINLTATSLLLSTTNEILEKILKRTKLNTFNLLSTL